MVQQPWSLRALIGAVLGVFLFVVVPPLVGKKEVTVAKGGDGGGAEVGVTARPLEVTRGKSLERTRMAKVALAEQLTWVAAAPPLEALADR